MNVFRLLMLFAIALIAASCATVSSRDVGPEYEEGRLMARELAKKDVNSCYWSPRKVDNTFKARKREYREMLTNQGRTKTFIEGFFIEYERYFKHYIKTYCSI
jgi:hypothetical protein